MSDGLNDALKEAEFDKLYESYLRKLLLYLEVDSLINEINFYDSLVMVAKAKPTPRFIDQKIARMRALKRGNGNEWFSLSKELEEQGSQALKELFEKIFKQRS